jgi:hypothetical protein
MYLERTVNVILRKFWTDDHVQHERLSRVQRT